MKKFQWFFNSRNVYGYHDISEGIIRVFSRRRLDHRMVCFEFFYNRIAWELIKCMKNYIQVEKFHEKAGHPALKMIVLQRGEDII